MNATKSTNSVLGSDGLAGRRFCKARALSAKLGVCPKTVFRWADAGMLTRHKINARVVLFDEAEVLAVMENARVVSR